MRTEHLGPDHNLPDSTDAHDGIVTWDRRGIVVVWRDGHRTALPWAVVRAACRCDQCRGEEPGEEPAPTR